MPLRPLNREQTWLLPPTLDELIPKDHPARFVAVFVDSLDRAVWSDMGIGLDGEPLGAPAYNPRALLSVWLYGFMTGTRSSRKLEAWCRDQLPYLWLTGWQHPDHNTLWRFYQEHRGSMQSLFKQTVRTAVKIGLVDLAIQAVDGTKVAGNASKDRSYDAYGLKQLLERTDAAIANLEAQNESGDDPPPPHLPEQLTQKQRLREEVKAAVDQLKAEEGRRHINLTDKDAKLMKSRQGIVPGYNLQAVVAPVETAQGTGLLIVAADVVQDQCDMAQLEPMLKQTEDITGRRPDMLLADAGYCSGSNLEACAEISQVIAMPISQQQMLKQLYHKDHFTYDVSTDSYSCPLGKTLRFAGIKSSRNKRRYRASGSICTRCSAFGTCTSDRRQGRAIEIGPHEEVLHRHREWMTTKEAKDVLRRRKELSEPAFGILKEQQGARKFLLRGLAHVNAEARLLVTAFNLRTLCKNWQASLIYKDCMEIVETLRIASVPIVIRSILLQSY